MGNNALFLLMGLLKRWAYMVVVWAIEGIGLSTPTSFNKKF